MNEMGAQYIIVYGNVIDGLVFLGPYPSVEAATHVAERDLEGQPWDIASLFSTPEHDGDVFRVIAPKRGGAPEFQFWRRDGEEGEPLLSSEYLCLTDWLFK
jgi:hypothetical protein